MLSKIEGRFQIMVIQLFMDKSPFEFSLSGVDLGSARCEMFSRCLAFNSTLLSVHMSRKRLSDADGQLLAKVLYENTSLRKMELEGNQLGPKSAAEFGKALKNNNTLKFLDLESNQLTVDG